MGQETSIAWCDHTFNPWLGCMKVSEGCAHCYAENDTPARTHRAKGLELWGPSSTASRVRTSDAYWKQPARWDRAAARDGVRRRVFCASQADVFEDNELVVGWRTRLFEIIEQTPHLDWQLLTKRPENLRRFLPASWMKDPRPNVWLGTTVEHQRAAEQRIPQLLRTPAAVRFLSCEPLLERVDLTELQVVRPSGVEQWDALCREYDDHLGEDGPRVDWVIVGGESGSKARPFDLAWARSIIRQCKDAHVPVFCKQLGAEPVNGTALCKCGHALSEHRLPLPAPCTHGHRSIDGLRSAEDAMREVLTPQPAGACECIAFSPVVPGAHRVSLVDSHGADPSEWPEDLRVQEFPTVGGAA